MRENGLISVINPEKIFLLNTEDKVPGRIVSAIFQGTRPVLIEIESLVVPSKMAFPKRIAQGVDSKRLEILIAVLIKHCKLPLYEYDCFINVAGGISAYNPSVDLAICLSIASSFFNKPINKNLLAIGEVGLLGEIRPIPYEERIIKLGKRLGYKNALLKGSKTLQQVVHNFFLPLKSSEK